MIARPNYIHKLLSFRDKELIKIITGIRRVGKSTILNLYKDTLLQKGIKDRQIQWINLEDIENEHLLNYKTLHDHIKTHLIKDKMNYIFLDEIQNVKNFQKTVRSLFNKGNIDIYLTGSNSKMLSGEWATSLSGRFVEIHVLPLSFKEYVEFMNNNSSSSSSELLELYNKYIEYGSLPQVVVDFLKPSTNLNKTSIHEYLQGVYSTVVLKDILERQKEKSTSINITALENIVKFTIENSGNLTSPNNIANTMTQNHNTISTPSVDNYLKALENSFIIYKAGRYDIKGKKALLTLDKYYLVDMGIRYLLLGNRPDLKGNILENIVYFELLRRGYKVSVGKITIKTKNETKNIEVDFVAQKAGGIVEYYQVALTAISEKTFAREIKSLEKIDDNYPKYLLTLDPGDSNYQGIFCCNVLHWLLKE